jgi:hypothetical protein
MHTLTLSTLPHTWLIDVDGTVLRHNGYKSGRDDLLPGVADLWARIPDGDFIVLLTARAEAERVSTLAVFDRNGLRFDCAIFGLPAGERVLINDSKPSGVQTAVAINVKRDVGLSGVSVVLDPML